MVTRALAAIVALVLVVSTASADVVVPPPPTEDGDRDWMDGVAEFFKEANRQGGGAGLFKVLCNLKPETKGCDRLPKMPPEGSR